MLVGLRWDCSCGMQLGTKQERRMRQTTRLAMLMCGGLLGLASCDLHHCIPNGQRERVVDAANTHGGQVSPNR